MTDDARQNMRNEQIGRERVAGLPISGLMMDRISEVTNDEGLYETDDVVPFIIAAVVSLEELIRGE